MSKYIKELHIYNFQSHGESHFEFSPGLNVIVGPSDQGKSAVIRALRWLMYNKPQGEEFIRAGAAQCKVKVVLNDGTVIERIRSAGGRINRYVLNVPGEEAQVFENFGREKDIPQEIRKALDTYRLVVDSDQVLEMNIAQQLDPPFLLAETAGKRYKILGRIANLHIVDSARRQVENDIRQCKRDAGQIEKDISELEQKLEDYADLEDQETNLAEIEALLAKIKRNVEKENELVSLAARRRVVHSEITAYEQMLAGMSGLPKAETDLKAIAECVKKLQEIETLHIRHKQLIMEMNKCEDIIRRTASIVGLEPQIEKLKELREQGAELQQTRKNLLTILADKRDKAERLRACMYKLSRLTEIETAEKRMAVLAELLRRKQELEQVAADYGLKKKRLSDAKAILEAKIKELTGMVDDYGKLLREAGRCPTCLASVDSETIERIHEQMLL